ncbi:MAG: hypothetical protein JXB32_09505 [Deltaproteobacteria bacterium]|nr:hypothetical protein [Deltaproteobacteria bacterium]
MSHGTGLPLAAALLAATTTVACPGPVRRPPPRGPDVGYVEWIAERPWALGDLPAVSASFDQLCLRADEGDARATELTAAVGPALWLTRSMLLPILRVLPGDERVPAEAETAGTCPAGPVPWIEAAVREFADPALREHAVELLLAGETQGAADGTGDEARLARVILAVTLLFPLEALAPDTATLADAVATLDPDRALLVPAESVGGACANDAAGPLCLWERLAAQGLMDATGAEALDRASLDPAALEALARHGLLNLAARNLLPVAEDPEASLRLLAAELTARLAGALQVEPEDVADDQPGEQDWPEAIP